MILPDRALPGYARQMLGSCPASGSGVHQWLFQCARVLRRYCEEPEIARLLEAGAAGCGRALEPHEIPDAIRNSRSLATTAGSPGVRPGEPRWPRANPIEIEKTARGGIGLVDLWERSPLRLEGEGLAEWIVEQLFPGNPLLCCARSKTDFATLERERWRGRLSQMQLLVPNPMSAPRGERKRDGKLSARTLDNTGPRRFLVIECDYSMTTSDGSGPSPLAPLISKLAERGISVADLCASVLWRLRHFMPLVMAVHSGGKSVHGWYNALGDPEDALFKFMRFAVSLGADDATWSRCQLVRMPEGTRRDDAERRLGPQPVYYFNPEALPR